MILLSRFWLTSSDSSPVAAENVNIITITARLKAQKTAAKSLFFLRNINQTNPPFMKFTPSKAGSP